LLYLGTPVFMRLNREQAFLYASSIWGVGLLVLVNVLVDRGVMRFTDLPEAARNKLQHRANTRAQVEGL
ncbi:hypothetical protein R0G64_32995, partial [Pseudomonas otitidis]|nr:hypothetical protein [Pseudomonas otitidis]